MCAKARKCRERAMLQICERKGGCNGARVQQSNSDARAATQAVDRRMHRRRRRIERRFCGRRARDAYGGEAAIWDAVRRTYLCVERGKPRDGGRAVVVETQ